MKNKKIKKWFFGFLSRGGPVGTTGTNYQKKAPKHMNGKGPFYLTKVVSTEGSSRLRFETSPRLVLLENAMIIRSILLLLTARICDRSSSVCCFRSRRGGSCGW